MDRGVDVIGTFCIPFHKCLVSSTNCAFLLPSSSPILFKFRDVLHSFWTMYLVLVTFMILRTQTRGVEGLTR